MPKPPPTVKEGSLDHLEATGTRNLLDLFEAAIDPVSGKLAIIYPNDRLTTDSTGNPLPQIELAQQT